jgi:hypothetical protein
MSKTEAHSSPEPYQESPMRRRMSNRNTTDLDLRASGEVGAENQTSINNLSNENKADQTPLEMALEELVDEALRQLKTFLIIIYGCCVRFYSTVVDWEYIQRMSEDLIERMTSKIFENPTFSK